MSLSVHDLNSRARNFQENAKQRFEADRRKAEKERIVKERARARREAHEAAVAELRRRQEEEAEKVFVYNGTYLYYMLESACPCIAVVFSRKQLPAG